MRRFQMILAMLLIAAVAYGQNIRTEEEIKRCRSTKQADGGVYSAHKIQRDRRCEVTGELLYGKIDIDRLG